MATAKPAAKAAPVKKTAPTKAAPAKSASAKAAPAKTAKKAAAPATPSKVRVKELTALVAGKLPLVNAATIGRVIEETFNAMKEQYAAGNLVDIKDFGKLQIKNRPARQGRNPATGETIQIAASVAPKFTFAKAMKELVK